MKHLKMLGLAAVALAAMMAYTAASASATELYSGATTQGVGTKIVSSLSGTASLTTTGGTVLDTCTGGTVTGEITAAGSATSTTIGTVATSGVTWSGCTKTTDTLEGGELEIHWIAGTHNGTVTGKKFKVTVVVSESFGGTCSYTLGTSTHLGTLIGTTTAPSQATLAINAVVNGAAGNSFLCPSDTKWVANYTVTSPVPLAVKES
jgi:hypothetical protein